MELRDIVNKEIKPKLTGREKFEDIIYPLSILTSQSYGTTIEKFIIDKLNMSKVKAKENRGDSCCNGKYYEIKISLITSTNVNLNLVQIRNWQNIDGYICCAFDIRDKYKEYIFYLNKNQMVEELELMNASSAHGTKKVSDANKHIEKRFSIKIDNKDKNFQRWINNYLIKDILELECKNKL